jgi:AraC family transcriptional regulator
MDLHEHGATKYSGHEVLAGTAGAWPGIVADVRRHPAGEIPAFRPQHTEVAIAVRCDPTCVVRRTGDGLPQATRVEPGTIWFCPVGVLEEDIRISAWHEVLHIYLPPDRFTLLNNMRGGAACRPETVRYLGGIFDEGIRWMGQVLLGEIREPSAAGALLVDALALRLTERLADAYSSDGRGERGRTGHPALDQRRLRRVLDYMNANLEEAVGLNELAGVASLSPFHFNRAFRRAMGVPPHRYLASLRLERAKTLLAIGDTSIADIAFASGFVSQSNFTRAFHRATGTTPRAYRGIANEGSSREPHATHRRPKSPATGIFRN